MYIFNHRDLKPQQGKNMRALITCSSKISEEDLKAFLVQNKWWPSRSQEDEIVSEIREAIIAQTSDDDQAYAKKTCLFTIYDSNSRSWGIVNKPNEGVLVFRIKNSISIRLEQATEKLVSDLLEAKTAGFNFEDKRIDVLQPNSREHAFYGEILPFKNRFGVALQDRRTEEIVGLIALGVAILFLGLTFPSVKHFFWGHLPLENQQWIDGVLGRLATAAVVTFTTNWIVVLLHWFNLRRKSIINWHAD